jgi:hypothetical protein
MYVPVPVVVRVVDERIFTCVGICVSALHILIRVLFVFQSLLTSSSTDYDPTCASPLSSAFVWPFYLVVRVAELLDERGSSWCRQGAKLPRL